MKERCPIDGEGIFALYKPRGITSQRAVQIVKHWARKKTHNKKIKVGHGGTLDPLAEGVLVIAVGRSYTKNLATVVKAQKEYRAEITLGATTTTDDAEGEKTIVNHTKQPTHQVLEDVCAQFVGNIVQTPPAYSAIKINGQEAYKRIRRGEHVVMKQRRVQIDAITILDYHYPVVHIKVVCGTGTYIRSLARDIGATLGTGAFLSGLVRTRVGTFSLDDACDIAFFEG